MEQQEKNNKASFNEFGQTFQQKLVALIIKQKEFADRMTEVLNPQQLERRHLQNIVYSVFDYYAKYKTYPTIDTIETIVKTTFDKSDTEYDQTIHFLEDLKNNRIALDDAEFVKSKSIDFCRKQKLSDAMIKSINLLKACSFEDIKKVIDDAVKLGAERDFGTDYHEDFEKRYLDEEDRQPIPTGWALIDEITQGGLGRKEIGVVMAPTGVGKSFCLTNMAAHAIQQGFNVLYFSLELSENIIHKRVDSRLTNIEIDELSGNQDKVREVEKTIPGTLKVKWFPKKSASVDRLRMFIEKLRETQDWLPDVIMVDYADIMKPAFNNPEKRHGIEGIYEDLEAMAQELDAALWTCSQTNRGGTQKEFVELDSTSEAFAKCFGAYLILTLQRSPQDKVANAGKMFVAKNRNGPDGLLYSCFIDTSVAKIEVLRQMIKTDDGEMTLGSGHGHIAQGETGTIDDLLKNNKLNLSGFLKDTKKKVAE